MAVLNVGDIVVLVSGSPRFAVESMQGTAVSCIWCNEGIIHRDTFDMALLRKWEEGSDRGGRGGDRGGDRGGRGGDRGGDRGGRGGDRGGDRKGGFKGGDRKGGEKPYGNKPYEGGKKDKSFFRKD